MICVAILSPNIIVFLNDFLFDFSTRNLQNFLALRNYNKISKVVGALPLLKSSRISNRLFNRYLDRTCSWLITNADGLVFQSKISLEMHKTFLNFKINRFQ